MTGPAEILWRGPTPHAARYGDLYYSADDPIGEIRHTFLDGVVFDDLCQADRLTIGETGFGTGLNFLVAWARFLVVAGSSATLDFVSVERHPISLDDMERAHAPFPEFVQEAKALRAAWPGAVPGVHRLRFLGGRVRLILLIGEAADMLGSMTFEADAWFLDGFAPARNPEMWREAVLGSVARLARPGAAVATFTAAGAVRRGLDAAGFEIEKRPGFGRKRDCLSGRRREHDARRRRPAWAVPPPPRPGSDRIAVVGDGIAGIALAATLNGAGKDVIHIGGSDGKANAGSGVPRALIAPKLVRGDQPFPVFWRQAFTDAVRILDGLGEDVPWVGARGLLIPADSEASVTRNRRLAEALGWPIEELRIRENGDIFVPRAGSVDPERLRNALSGAPSMRADIAAIERQDGIWRLTDDTGRVVLESDVVILACGAGTERLLPGSGRFGLRVGGGRAAVLRSDTPRAQAILKNGYATSSDLDGRFVCGATVERWPSDGSKEDGIRALRDRIAPLTGDAKEESTWFGLRCDTTDHLPLVGAVPDLDAYLADYDGLRVGKPLETMPGARYLAGLFTVSGLGARGFQAAFLAADLIVSMIDGRAMPVSATIQDALHPGRFIIRDLKRGTSGEKSGVADGT